MKQPDIYPTSFEAKVGFDEVRLLISALCTSCVARERTDTLCPLKDPAQITALLEQTAEMKAIITRGDELPAMAVEDVRPALKRIKPEGTYLDEHELLSVLFALQSLSALYHFFRPLNATEPTDTPHLSHLLCNVPLLPKLEITISQIFDTHKRIADGASPELLRIRREMTNVERAASRTIDRILRKARSEGWVEIDAQPTIRDGRLTLPVIPSQKRALPGIVQGESATGRTVFIEPAEVVEASNHLRQLEGEEQREIIRILTEVTSALRPFIREITQSINLVGLFDFIAAKARFAIQFGGHLPKLVDKPHLSWISAQHPILLKSLAEHNRAIVPLDISLTAPDRRILVISGPNAGGKSVCLKTVGLIQYMLQCGMLPTISPDSEAGIFDSLCIDIGDEQSLEDDLSTYSSHLRNMKAFVHSASNSTLLLIDEFGSGTEPRMGGALAEALLSLFNERGAFGIITTHYYNLKTLAEEAVGLVNGAMLYDRAEMKPLFRLAIGRPGSSFAIEIARKTGLPEEVINRAAEIVGQDYIDMDKYLQDIVRDKRYWEEKRRNIRREEKRLQETTAGYATKLESLNAERKQIITAAKHEAEQLIEDARRRIEGTIRTIKEAQAEREQTRKARIELEEYRSSLDSQKADKQESENDKYNRELARIERRNINKEKRRTNSISGNPDQESALPSSNIPPKQIQTTYHIGDAIQVAGQEVVGKILELNTREAIVALGNLKLTVPISRIQHADKEAAQRAEKLTEEIRDRKSGESKTVADLMYQKRLDFKSDIDVRGMRANEAVTAVSYYLDDAIHMGLPRVRILHGTGSGALRQAIREYLSGFNGIERFTDEHVQFGGAGITVVDLL